MYQQLMLNRPKKLWSKSPSPVLPLPPSTSLNSSLLISETFLLSNVAPQVGDGFNRHYWAYLEAFCRTLTTQFTDVYVFTVPLFLPRQSGLDGKWYVNYEMIAPQNSAPSIAVPTHFAKVIMASREKRGGGSLGGLVKSGGEGEKEWSVGAFVLPNDVIDEKTPLTNFVVPSKSFFRFSHLPFVFYSLVFIITFSVEAVESSAGLSLLPDAMKVVAKPLCQVSPTSINLKT